MLPECIPQTGQVLPNYPDRRLRRIRIITMSSGAACRKACGRLGITERTFYRWQKRKSMTGSFEDGRPSSNHSNLPNRISDEIRQEIIAICNSEEYASSAPCEIVPDLADKGRYVVSAE